VVAVSFLTDEDIFDEISISAFFISRETNSTKKKNIKNILFVEKK